MTEKKKVFQLVSITGSDAHERFENRCNALYSDGYYMAYFAVDRDGFYAVMQLKKEYQKESGPTTNRKYFG